jgi:transaldolase
LISQASALPAYENVVTDALKFGMANGTTLEDKANRAIDRVAIEFGLRILKVIPGRVSTEVDARLSFDTQKTIDKARATIAQYKDAGVAKERILVKIAATWEGIKAAEVLEREGIHCNLTLLFGLHQAVACAHAGVTLISPFVGRILDWHKKKHGRDFVGQEDPGVQNVTQIYNYFKKYGHKTEVMGASFRNTGEITELAGCDLLTISPQLLAELQGSQASLARKLDASQAASMTIAEIKMDEAVFRAMHAADPMATDKLKEGIEGFEKAIVTLEADFAGRIAKLS